MGNVQAQKRIKDIYHGPQELLIEPLIENKWIPDDKIVDDWNKYSGQATSVPFYKNKLRDLKETYQNYTRQCNELNDMIDPTSVARKIELKEEKYKLDFEINKCEESIRIGENVGLKAMQDYERYMERAKKFLTDNGLYKYISVRDILHSRDIVIFFTKLKDSYYLNTVNKKQEYMDKFVHIVGYFDLPKAVTKTNYSLYSDYNHYVNNMLTDGEKNIFRKDYKLPINNKLLMTKIVLN